MSFLAFVVNVSNDVVNGGAGGGKGIGQRGVLGRGLVLLSRVEKRDLDRRISNYPRFKEYHRWHISANVIPGALLLTIHGIVHTFL